MLISAGVGTVGGGIEMTAGIVGGNAYHTKHGFFSLATGALGIAGYSEATPLTQASVNIVRVGISFFFK
jgi:hypothetical protein